MEEFPKSKGLIIATIVNLVVAALGILATVVYANLIGMYFSGLLMLALVELAFAIAMFVAIQSGGRKLFTALRIIASSCSALTYFVLTIVHLTTVMSAQAIDPDFLFAILFSAGALAGFVFSLLHFIYLLKEIRSPSRSFTYMVSCRGEILSTCYMFLVLVAYDLFRSFAFDELFNFSSVIVIGLLVSFLFVIALVYNKQKAKA